MKTQKRESQKVANLKTDIRLWKETLGEETENVHVKILEMELKDAQEEAAKQEAKRIIRKTLRHLKKKVSEVEALRVQAKTLLSGHGALSLGETIKFQDELRKTFDTDKLIWGEN